VAAAALKGSAAAPHAPWRHAMRRLLCPGLGFLLLALPFRADGYTRQQVAADLGSHPSGLSEDCVLTAYNTCSGWIWIFSDVEGAVWGLVLDPADCPGGCRNGGAASDVYLYSRCASVPGTLGGIGLCSVDARGCPTDLLYESGPLTVTHCVSGDRWTHLELPLAHVNGNPFALTVEWGPASGSGESNPQLATDCGLGNLLCRSFMEYCAGTSSACDSWDLRDYPQVTFIYVTDLDGGGDLEDICALYGAPESLAFPYLYGYGYLPNNLLAVVGLDCSSPTAVEPTSWGHVKALFR
jgi:hypothetical protein